jgi:hypothetical protein
VSHLDAFESNEPLKLEILEKLRRQFASEPSRCRREIETEFADDEDSWFSMALVTRCVDQNLEYVREGAILRFGSSSSQGSIWDRSRIIQR